VQDLGAISNGMFKLKGPTMLQNSYSPAFPLKHQQKDMRLALALGDENAVSMPIAAAANEVKLFFKYFLFVAKMKGSVATSLVHITASPVNITSGAQSTELTSFVSL